MLREAGYSGYVCTGSASRDARYRLPGRKVAVFVTATSGTVAPLQPAPAKTNREFWERKFALNAERDKRKVDALEALGWTVVVVWECRTERRPQTVTSRLVTVLT